jgi:hypothetical protein
MNINLGISLDGLNDVDSTGKATGDVLEWNAVTSKWEAATPSGGGAAGTDGQIQFNNSGAFGADSGLVWDNTNKRLGVGASPATTVRLDVRAQGALSTDVAFRVRNSANTLNFAQFNGDGTYFISSAGDTVNNSFSRVADGRMFMAKSGTNFIELNATNGQNRLFFSSNGLEISTGSVQTNIVMSSTSFRFYQNTVQLTATLQVGSGTNALLIQNGTAPSANRIDHHWYYSADITAGNAAPHFRTENGAIIKLYQQSSAGITTVADLVTILQNTGLLS